MHYTSRRVSKTLRFDYVALNPQPLPPGPPDPDRVRYVPSFGPTNASTAQGVLAGG